MSGMCGVRGRLLACALFVFILVAGLCDESAAGQAAMADSIAEKIAASKDLLDINMATAAQLKALPGMGDAYVQRVIETAVHGEEPVDHAGNSPGGGIRQDQGTDRRPPAEAVGKAGRKDY